MPPIPPVVADHDGTELLYFRNPASYLSDRISGRWRGTGSVPAGVQQPPQPSPGPFGGQLYRPQAAPQPSPVPQQPTSGPVMGQPMNPNLRGMIWRTAGP
jgi:hypothetical protein